MSDKLPSTVNDQTPVETHSPGITKAKTYGGGLPAVLSSMKYTLTQMTPLRGARGWFAINQKGGFDCPGCAWPDPDDRRSMVEFCENGIKALAEEATHKKVGPEFFLKNSISMISRLSDYEIGKLGRITHPIMKEKGADHFTPVSWDKAFEVIAAELKALNSPFEATFYTSGRTSNEAAFLYQLMVRLYGSNNLPDCSNMCHESSGVALTESLGIGKGSVTLHDFEHSDLVIIMGQNPGTNHPRMLTTLHECVKRGCKIVSINPLAEAALTAFQQPQEITGLLGKTTPIATMHLPVKINGDVALLKGVMKELLALEDANPGQIFRHDFIVAKTSGYEDFIAQLRQEDWSLIIQESGIAREELKKLAKMISESKNMIICWAMGLTQHKNAVANIQEVVNLLLLGGHIGRKGAGTCPVRGHSNVQGDRTMGIFEKIPEAFLDSLQKEFHFLPSRKHGKDVIDCIRAMDTQDIKVFIGMGGNFLSATPDTDFVAQALRKCKLTVNVATKLNRGHLMVGDVALVLPCLGRSEIDEQVAGRQFVSVENSMGVVSSSEGNLGPASKECRSEVAIICGLAETLFKGDPAKETIADWPGMRANYDRIRDHIANVVPGFENYNERVRHPGGFYLPNASREGEFETPDKKAHFTVHQIAPANLKPGHLMLMTIRSHDQFNTTIYGLNDRYRGIHSGRRVIMMNPEDMQARGLRESQAIDVTSHWDPANFVDQAKIAKESAQANTREGHSTDQHVTDAKPEETKPSRAMGIITRTAKSFYVVPYEIPRGCVAAYYPEANVLVPVDSVAEKSNTPTYKSIHVTVQPAVAP